MQLLRGWYLTESGEGTEVEAGFVTIATGVNSHGRLDYGDDPLIASLKRLNPEFVPGKSRKAFIFEFEGGTMRCAASKKRSTGSTTTASQRVLSDRSSLSSRTQG
jgi:hypothetical protein